MSNRQIDNIDTGKPALPAKRKRRTQDESFLSKISVFTAALALLSLSHASYAEDQKTYPGTACDTQTLEDPDPDIVETDCPIVRDNIANTNGTKEAWVRVFNDGGVVRCTLSSLSAYGALIASKTASTTATGNQFLNVDVNASANSGFYNLFCMLPCLAGSDFACNTRVVSYRINEF